MKRIALLLAVCFIAALALAACGTETEVATPSDAVAVSDSEPVVNALTWLGENKIYLDLNLSEGAAEGLKITVNGAVLSAGTAADYSPAYAASAEGAGTVKLSVYLAYEYESGGVKQVVTSYGGGIKAGEVNGASALASVLNADLERAAASNAGKVYICVTDKDQGWDHGLSELLNKRFTSGE